MDPCRWFDQPPGVAAKFFRGRFAMMALQDGLAVHTLEATALRPLDVTAVRKPGVVLHYFLEGHADATLAGRSMNLGRRAGEPVRMVMTAIRDEQLFLRRSVPGDHVRKVNLILTHDWLAQNGIALPGDPQADGQQRVEQAVGPEDILQLERLLQVAGHRFGVGRLEAEAISLGLVCGVFAKLLDDGKEVPDLSVHDKRKLDRMEQFIQDGVGEMPSLAEIAGIGGVSLSTLRRLFRSAHDSTVQDYVRNVRIARARDALERDAVSVSEAALIAGYRSAANFSTAFRRATGVAPSQIRRTVRKAQSGGDALARRVGYDRPLF